MVVDTNYLEAVLNGPELNDTWKGCLDSYEQISSKEKLTCLAAVIEFRDHLLDVVADVTDPEERESCLALFYLLVKADWMLLNTQYTYQINANKTNHKTIVSASLYSAFLGALEPYVRQVDRTRIEALLAQLPNGDDLPDGSELDQTAFQAKLRELSETLAARDATLVRMHADWEILDAGIGKKTAREIVELVRELKDELLQRQRQNDPTGPLPEKYSDFDREFGGLTARQIAQQIERQDEKIRQLETEARQWTEGQQLLLKSIGDAEPVRLVAKFSEMQDRITELTMTLAKNQQRGDNNFATATQSNSHQAEDLAAMLGDLESALSQMNT
jgi:hypothetical protein